MLKRHEIEVLREAGHSQESISQLSGASVRTVRRIGQEGAHPRRSRRRPGRPAQAEPFRDWIKVLLESEPHLLTLEILRRARLDGYAAGKSAMYQLVATLRPTPVVPLVRFEGLAGEFVQHDFGEVEVRFVDGTIRRYQFFATRWKYSRWTQVALVTDQRAETLVRALVDHYAAIGGVPLLAVFDRPKTVAVAWKKDGTVTKWNAIFAEVMLQLGVSPELCWPYQPRQKGSVENLVGWVKGSFFKQRRFIDDVDLRQQLAEWHTDVNTRRPSRATSEIPELRMTAERPRLRPLKVTPETLALRIPVVVRPTANVLHDTHEYSMPPNTIGMGGTLFLYRDRVQIIAGIGARACQALHLRLFEPRAKSILPEHRIAMVAKVRGLRAKQYLKREHLLEAGKSAEEYLTALIYRQPKEWAAEVDELHWLLVQHGPRAMGRAFTSANLSGALGAESIAHLLNAGRQEVAS